MTEQDGSDTPPTPDIDDLVEEIAEHYLDRLHAGLAANRQELAGLLDRKLKLVEILYSAAKPESSAAEAETSVAVAEPSQTRTALADPLRQIGRYRLEGELGRGASGTVYKAHDPKHNRFVALKVLHRDGSALDAGERFARDARIAAQLRHPNIVPLHDTGEHAGVPYIDMELVRGETLAARLKRAPVDPRVGVDWVRKIAEALDYAHGQGIVHRDVKPSNILLDERGEPQLIDFSLARREADEATLTTQGQILGTLLYMSPEQARGAAHHADGRTDIYSLGVVLYQLLTGRLPFASTEGAPPLLHQIAHAQPTALRSVRPDVPHDLETICLKALAKDPADRFGSAAAFADELRRWLRDEPLSIRRPTPWTKVCRWGRRNRPLVRVVGVASLLLALLGGVAWLKDREAAEARWREATEARARAEVQIRVLLERARQRMRGLTQGRRLQAQELLTKIRAPRKLLAPGPDTDQLDLEIRSTFAATLALPDLQLAAAASLLDDWSQTWRVALSPDGESLVVGTHRGPVRWVRGAAPPFPTGRERKQRRPRVTFSPDGKFLAFAPVDGGLRLYDGKVTEPGRDLEPTLPVLGASMVGSVGALRGAGPLPTVAVLPCGSAAASPVLAVGWTPRGQVVWACRADGQVRSWCLRGLERGPAWSIGGRAFSGTAGAGAAPVTAAAFNPQATALAVGDGRGNVHLAKAGGVQVRSFHLIGLPVEALAWSPDGKVIAAGTQDGTVWLHRIDDQRLLHRLRALPDGVGSIVFSPDGRWVFAGGRSSQLKMWDAETGEPVLTGVHVPGGISRDGRRLGAGHSSEVVFHDVLLPEALRQLRGHRTRVEQLAWSRDNRHLASVDASFEVRVWDVARAVPVDRFAEAGRLYADNAAVALSDDGRTLAYASGGGKSQVVLRDVARQVITDRWQLPPGFERLACLQGSRFLLVREEAEAENWRSVAREVQTGQPLREYVLRPAVAGERRFFTHGLTPDGCYYWWCGPREPPGRYRAEVWKIPQKHPVHVELMPATERENHLLAYLSADGRFFWGGGREPQWVCDLGGKAPAKTAAEVPLAVSPDGRRFAFRLEPSKERVGYALAVREGREAPTWLEFVNDDLSSPEAKSTCFSPDGRYLAWSSQSGVIAVADLHALRHELAKFEKQLYAE